MTSGPLLGGRGGQWIGRRDPRLLVVLILLFALVTVSLQTLGAAGVALGLAAAAAAAGGQGFRALLKPLAVLEGVMLVLLATLPFTVPGEAMLTLGPLTATWQGLHAASLIVLRANAVVLALLGLLGGLEPAVLGHALARLGLPHKLVHLLLLTVRQIALLDDERQRLRRAMRARAFVPRSDRHTWNTVGWLMGMLLVRSLARSRRVLEAMRLRGWRGRLPLLDVLVWRTRDSLAALLTGLLLAALLGFDRWHGLSA